MQMNLVKFPRVPEASSYPCQGSAQRDKKTAYQKTAYAAPKILKGTEDDPEGYPNHRGHKRGEQGTQHEDRGRIEDEAKPDDCSGKQ